MCKPGDCRPDSYVPPSPPFPYACPFVLADHPSQAHPRVAPCRLPGILMNPPWPKPRLTQSPNMTCHNLPPPPTPCYLSPSDHSQQAHPRVAACGLFDVVVL
jgi:hypothetical protein